MQNNSADFYLFYGQRDMWNQHAKWTFLFLMAKMLHIYYNFLGPCSAGPLAPGLGRTCIIKIETHSRTY